MQNINILLEIANDSKFVKQIAHEVKNSKGSPTEIMARIAKDFNFELPKNLTIEVFMASDDVFHFIVPANLSGSIDGLEDSIVAAGNLHVRTSSTGTLSCASTVSCASSATSFFSLATAGTALCISTFGGIEENKKPRDKSLIHAVDGPLNI